MDKKNISKPITLVREEFAESIVNLCNNAGLPFFVIEDVLKSLLQDIHLAAQRQLAEDTKTYAAQISKQN